MTSTLRTVMLGASLLGAVGGLVGTYAFLRRQSLLGDALAHAALPGVAIAFLLTGSRHPLPILLGATVAGLVGALFMVLVVRGTRLKEDTALGIVLSVFFGGGILLLTLIQRMPGGGKSGLDHFLFGQAATLLPRDLYVLAVLAALVLATLVLLHKELKLLAFDPDYGRSLGLPMRAMEVLLTCLLVVVVVVGLQMVGAVLMVAALVLPAAAARQWTDRLEVMLAIAAITGAAAGGGGAVLSGLVERLPTGPTIVLLAGAVLLVSLLLAPKRGILWRLFEGRRLAGRIRREHLLMDLYRLGEQAGDLARAVSLPYLSGMRGTPTPQLARTLRRLLAAGHLDQEGDQIRLTPAGQTVAREILRRHRLWELYLSRRLELPSDHVHRPADDMEHALTPETVEALEELLGHPTTDPHGQPIPAGREA